MQPTYVSNWGYVKPQGFAGVEIVQAELYSTGHVVPIVGTSGQTDGMSLPVRIHLRGNNRHGRNK